MAILSIASGILLSACGDSTSKDSKKNDVANQAPLLDGFIESVTPEDRAKDVDPSDVEIRVQFTKDMKPESIDVNSIKVVDSSGNKIEGDITYADRVALSASFFLFLATGIRWQFFCVQGSECPFYQCEGTGS